LLIAAACFGGALQAYGALADIEVTVEPPAVARVEFDPREPPSEMPAGLAGAGLCHNVFEIEASIVSSIEALSPTIVRAYPAEFDLITRLRITIYTPKGAPRKLLAHEEGHRTIGEYYYVNAESAARDAAMSISGRAFEAYGVDRAAAEQAVGELVLAALKDEFMQRTHARSAAANVRYDAITEHGLAAVSEAQAVAAALAEDP
jgi:hypothetical protein